MSLRNKPTSQHSKPGSLKKQQPGYVKVSRPAGGDVAGANGGGGGGMETLVDRRKSRVGEKMKKRLSMRYADTPTYSPAPPLPIHSALPREMRQAFQDTSSSTFADLSTYSLTGTRGPTAKEMMSTRDTTQEEEYVKPRNSLVPGMLMRRAEGRGGVGASTLGELELERKKGWDLEPLKGEVDVQSYIKQRLAGAEEDEMAGFKEALMNRKGENAMELKQNVFKNYAQFVDISKEISTLENDMLELKDLLAEWKTVPELLGLGVGAEEVGNGKGISSLERRKTARNSLLDLQKLYRTQLQSLWTTISGSQKFLPLLPGRHLVCEAKNFVELNSATYKVKQNVELFLLNDLLLVAARKRKREDAGRKEEKDWRLVAERCWNLTEVVVVDVKDSGDLTNAIKVRRGKETFVYRTSRADDKKALLAAFRHVSSELSNKKRKENEKEQEKRKSMWGSDMLGHFSQAGAPPMPSQAVSLPSADGPGQESIWLDSFEDHLTMAIATKSWEDAVSQVEKARLHIANPAAKASTTSLNARLSKLIKHLVSEIVYDLSDPNIKRSQVVRLVALLNALEEGELGRDTFLAARKALLQKRIRMIGFDGDIYLYINELGLVTFTILKHTSEWFLAAFKENRMASGLSEWLQEQVEQFADTFRRQVHDSTISQDTVDQCLRVTATHNRKLLREAGHDFTFLLSTLLQPDHSDPTILPNQVFTEHSVKPVISPRTTSEERLPNSADPEVRTAPSARRPSAGEATPRPPPRSERRARAPPKEQQTPDLV